MIPSSNNILTTEVEIEVQPSKDYKLYIEEDTINGFCDNLLAMKQTIYKILNTERYMHPMYSWNYGIETIDLYGEPVTYVCPEIQRRIEEALIQDDRITSVSDFEFNVSNKKTVLVTFIVHTIFGDVESEKVVNF